MTAIFWTTSMNKTITSTIPFFIFSMSACMPESKSIHADAKTNLPEQTMNQNTQDIMTAQCADTQFHQPDKEEIIICAARKDDIEKMRKLQNAAL